MRPFTIGAIFARGGSKRVPRKNLRLVGGKPLIAHAIDIGLASELIDEVVVSTDDREIADTARRFGATVPFIRPSDLAGDDTSEWLAWQHLIKSLNQDSRFPEIDIFVCIPVTSPLRTVEDLDSCIRKFEEGGADVVVTVTTSSQNPYYNIVTIDGEGYARQMIETEMAPYRRDAYPISYDMTTVAYVADPNFVLNSVNPFEGRVKAVVIPPERSLDIDTELDLDFADFILGRKGGDSVS